MAESANGKLEDSYTVPSENKDDAVAVDVAELKSLVEPVRDVHVEGNSESVNGTRDADSSHSDSSSSSSDEEEKEEVEEDTPKENDFVDKVVDDELLVSDDLDHVEDPVDNSEELKEPEEKIVKMETTESTAEIPKVDEELVLPVTMELADEVKKVEEESILPSSNESEQVCSVMTDLVSTGVDTALTSVIAVTDVSKTEMPVPDEASKESYGGTLQPSADFPPPPPPPPFENSKPANQPEESQIVKTTVNSSIISVSARTIQPTSWKGCCGLFDVLRRSDR